MPTRHLTDTQRQGFARFDGKPSADQLARYFNLDQTDRELIGTLRGDHNRLGFAVMLMSARFLGAFPVSPAEIPASVLATLIEQLALEPATEVGAYFEGSRRIRHPEDRRMPAYRSRTSTHGRNMAGARGLWRATGMKDGDFGKPIIAVCNSFTQFVPGHVHLKDLGQLVAREIERAGGVAKEFNTIAVDDGIAMGHDSMLYSPGNVSAIESLMFRTAFAFRAALLCLEEGTIHAQHTSSHLHRRVSGSGRRSQRRHNALHGRAKRSVGNPADH
jgi:hypothetical protein